MTTEAPAPRFRDVPAPRPILDRSREAQLTERQREILDQVTDLFADGFAGLTMAEIASRLNTSLRTLYEIAPSRDELVMTVVDRNLWRIGRTAMATVKPDAAPLDALRAYLRAATEAVSAVTEAFARDLATLPATQELNRQHEDYLIAITRSLLDEAARRHDIAPGLDTTAVARVMAGVGRDFARADVIPTLRSNPKAAADSIVDVILAGLTSHRKTSSDA